MFTFSIISVAQAGVISDAPAFTTMGSKILVFLLSVFSVVAIIMVVVSSMIYFFAFGDEKKLEMAKKSIGAWTIGLLIGLGSLVLVKFVAQFLA